MTCPKQPLDIEQLRLLVGDDQEPYDYTDEQYLKMYEAFPNIYRLAAHIWTLKGVKIQGQITNGGGITAYSSGDEKYEYNKLKDQLDYFNSMKRAMLDLAQDYEDECDKQTYRGSRIIPLEKPDILGYPNDY